MKGPVYPVLVHRVKLALSEVGRRRLCSMGLIPETADVQALLLEWERHQLSLDIPERVAVHFNEHEYLDRLQLLLGAVEGVSVSGA